ncbi:hypothetical protein Tco_1383909 [Tanacetum coccineum]
MPLESSLMQFWKHREPRDVLLVSAHCFQQNVGNGNPISPTTHSEVDNEIVMDFENSQLYKPSVRKSFERIPAISGLGQFDDLWANRCERFFRQSGSIASPDDRPSSQNVHRCTLARSARRHLHAHGAPTQSTRRSDAVTAGRFIGTSSLAISEYPKNQTPKEIKTGTEPSKKTAKRALFQQKQEDQKKKKTKLPVPNFY